MPPVVGAFFLRALCIGRAGASACQSRRTRHRAWRAAARHPPALSPRYGTRDTVGSSMRTPTLLAALALTSAAAALAAQPILTPKPGPQPKINGPEGYGARPGRPFLYRIPCTGERPMRFSAARLPKELKLDAATGIVSGATPAKRGEYRVTLSAANAKGKAAKRFRIVVGDTLALTPPMGWNDWYTHYDHVTDKLVRQAADAMIASGMADYGYQFVNIDDCWMVKPGSDNPELNGEPRDPDGAIRTNRRFPDMAALTAYI